MTKILVVKVGSEFRAYFQNSPKTFESATTKQQAVYNLLAVYGLLEVHEG